MTRNGGHRWQRRFATVQISSETLSTTRRRNCATRCSTRSAKGSDGKPSKAAISDSAVSETWGDQITKKALIALPSSWCCRALHHRALRALHGDLRADDHGF